MPREKISAHRLLLSRNERIFYFEQQQHHANYRLVNRVSSSLESEQRGNLLQRTILEQSRTPLRTTIKQALHAQILYTTQ